MSEFKGDPLTLIQRLTSESEENPLLAEAARRIQDLERLCSMMTDTGVILEEDVRHLVKADTWWLPDDGEACWTNLHDALEELVAPGEVLELSRAHTLENCYAVLFEEICDDDGKIVYPEEVREFETYLEAEEASADYLLRRRRVEYGQ